MERRISGSDVFKAIKHEEVLGDVQFQRGVFSEVVLYLTVA